MTTEISVMYGSEKVKPFFLVVDSLHRYSNEAETTNYTIYDDFKLKITLWYPWFDQTYLIARVNPLTAGVTYIRVSLFLAH